MIVIGLVLLGLFSGPVKARKYRQASPASAVTCDDRYMAAALGLTMRNERFQLAIMNDTEPSARDVAAFEQDLKDHKVRVMFYNKQASIVSLAIYSPPPVMTKFIASTATPP